MIIRANDLLVVVALMSIYSLLCASLFVVMHAMDVALTEAVVGAGISTLLMLEALALTGRGENSTPRHLPIAAIVVLVCGAALVYGIQDIPPFGSANAPIHLHVSPYYIENSLQQTGVSNVVTSILASYRGFDTYGELVVIFTACIGVVGLLANQRNHEEKIIASMEQHMVLRIVVKMLIPLILMFGLYVQFHGDYGPGGGFQAGVIFASVIILYSMIFGSSVVRQVVDLDVVQLLAALGVLIYGSVGLVSLIRGKNFLDYDALLANSMAGQHMGILLVEVGVGITVAAAMVVIFFSFTEYANRVIGSS